MHRFNFMYHFFPIKLQQHHTSSANNRACKKRINAWRTGWAGQISCGNNGLQRLPFAKKMSPQGPVPDSGKMLSGFPAENHLPVVDKSALKPGGWALFAQDLTATVGPWVSATARASRQTQLPELAHGHKTCSLKHFARADILARMAGGLSCHLCRGLTTPRQMMMT